jgi:hypothetical protein
MREARLEAKDIAWSGRGKLPSRKLPLNRRMPNGMYGGVRGRRLVTASYSIAKMIALYGIQLKELGRGQPLRCLRSMSLQKVKWAVMPSGTAKITPQGARFKNRFYTVEVAVSEHWFENARSDSNWTAALSYDPADCSSIAIWGPDYKNNELRLMDWQAKYMGKSFSEVASLKKQETADLKKLKNDEDLEVAKMLKKQEELAKEAQRKTNEAREKSPQSKSASVANINANRAEEVAALRKAKKEGASSPEGSGTGTPSPAEASQLAEDFLPKENPEGSAADEALESPQTQKGHEASKTPKASEDAGKAGETVPEPQKRVGRAEWLLGLMDSAESSNSKVIIENLLSNGGLWF